MASDRLKDCLNYFILDWEGRYWENNPDDPGGVTCWGILQSEYNDFRKRHNLPTRSMKSALNNDHDNFISEIFDCYDENYWTPAHCDDMIKQLDLMVLDTAVNQGLSTGIKYLQNALGLTADGVIGPKTIAGIKSVDTIDKMKEVCNNIYQQRKDRYYAIARHNPNMHQFLQGWLNRIDSLKIKAEKM
jgi:lysozyme family protein